MANRDRPRPPSVLSPGSAALLRRVDVDRSIRIGRSNSWQNRSGVAQEEHVDFLEKTGFTCLMAWESAYEGFSATTLVRS